MPKKNTSTYNSSININGTCLHCFGMLNHNSATMQDVQRDPHLSHFETILTYKMDNQLPQ